MSFRLSVVPLSDRTDNKPYDGELLVDNIYGDITISNNGRFESSTKEVKSDIQGMKINSKNVNKKIYNLISKLGNYKTDEELAQMDRNNLNIEDEILGSLQFIKNTYLNSDNDNTILDEKEKEYKDLYEKIYVKNSGLGDEDQQSLSLEQILKEQLYEIINLNGFISEDEIFNSLTKIKNDLFVAKMNQLQELKRKNEELDYFNKLIMDLIGNENNEGKKILEKQTEDIIKRYNNVKNETKNRKFLTSNNDYFSTEIIDSDSIFHFNNVNINNNFDIYTSFNRKYFNSMDEDNFIDYYNDTLNSSNFDGNDNLYIADSKFNIRNNEKEQNNKDYIKNTENNFNFSGYNDYKTTKSNNYNVVYNNLYNKDNNGKYIHKDKILYDNKFINDIADLGNNIIPEIPLIDDPEYYKHMSENVIFDNYYNKNIFQLLNTNHYASNSYISSSPSASYLENQIIHNKKIEGNNDIIPKNDWSSFYFYKNIEPYSFVMNKIFKDNADIFGFYNLPSNDSEGVRTYPLLYGVSPLFTIFTKDSVKDYIDIYENESETLKKIINMNNYNGGFIFNNYIDKGRYSKQPSKLGRQIEYINDKYGNSNRLWNLINYNNDNISDYLRLRQYNNLNRFFSYYRNYSSDNYMDNINNYYNKSFITNQYYTGFTPESIISKDNYFNNYYNFSEINKDLGFKEYLNIFKYHLINIKSIMEGLMYYDTESEKSLDFYFPDMLPFISFDNPYEIISIVPNYSNKDSLKSKDDLSLRSNLSIAKTIFEREKMDDNTFSLKSITELIKNVTNYSCLNFTKVKWYDEIIRFLSGNYEINSEGIKYLSYSMIENGSDNFIKLGSSDIYVPKAYGELNDSTATSITNNKIDLKLDFNVLYKNSDESEEKEFLNENDNFELNDTNFKNNYVINNNNYDEFIKKGSL